RTGAVHGQAGGGGVPRLRAEGGAVGGRDRPGRRGRGCDPPAPARPGGRGATARRGRGSARGRGPDRRVRVRLPTGGRAAEARAQGAIADGGYWPRWIERLSWSSRRTP